MAHSEHLCKMWLTSKPRFVLLTAPVRVVWEMLSNDVVPEEPFMVPRLPRADSGQPRPGGRSDTLEAVITAPVICR